MSGAAERLLALARLKAQARAKAEARKVEAEAGPGPRDHLTREERTLLALALIPDTSTETDW